MSDFVLASFFTIASVLFVTELTDKDAFLILAVASRVKWRIAFFAGASAFALTTLLFVTIGSLMVSFIPVYWVRVAGGAVMVGYGLWEARGLVGVKAAEEEESRVQAAGSALRTFLTLVGALALLDIAGDATEIVTIVFAAHYANALLVISAALTGLVAATAMEATLGNRLGHVLTPGRLRYLSAAVFLVVGTAIILLG